MSTELNPVEHTPDHTQDSQMFEEVICVFELICIQANQYFILPFSRCKVFYSFRKKAQIPQSICMEKTDIFNIRQQTFDN